MQLWMTFVLVLQLLAAITMIGLVLIQHGKGADMGASFGGGASGSLFGATGSANFLSRSTAVCATVFFVATLALAFMSNQRGSAAPLGGGSVLDRALPAASAASGVGSGQIPAAAPELGVVPAAAPSAAASEAPGAIPK
ncbi:MAG: preprotein translocase subunit SecG [Rubrivivax sp.]